MHVLVPLAPISYLQWVSKFWFHGYIQFTAQRKMGALLLRGHTTQLKMRTDLVSGQNSVLKGNFFSHYKSIRKLQISVLTLK